MKLSEYLTNNKMLFGKKGKLLIDIKLNSGEIRKKGDIVDILLDKGDGKYHAEDNDWACTVTEKEIKFI